MGQIKYEIELEIFEGTGCSVHKLGEKFKYPEDINKLCPFMLECIHSSILVLQFGGSLPWKYKGTRFEKEMDEEGVTTEYIRCPDPTDMGIVIKITRRKLEEPKAVEWC